MFPRADKRLVAWMCYVSARVIIGHALPEWCDGTLVLLLLLPAVSGPHIIYDACIAI